MALRQVVYAFDRGTAATKTPRVRGGKGAGLAQMAELALPIPPGFTLATGVSRAFREHGRFSRRVFGQLQRGIAELEKVTGRTFGDPLNPLLVSVRSGAPVSMPGMMDTILNVGLDPTNLDGLTHLYGESFAHDTCERFVQQWATLIGPVPLSTSHRGTPTDAWEQLIKAIEAVLYSWGSSRAVAYRAAHGIPVWTGTAVTVQAMVFGNAGDQSCTGVVFSGNVATGEDGLYGEFLPNAQGEDVVSGMRTPRPISELAAWNPQVFEQLQAHAARLAVEYGDVVDVEFTVEQGKLFMLQVRRAKLSPLAKVTRAVRAVWKKQLTHTEALKAVMPVELDKLCAPTVDTAELARMQAERLAYVYSGLPASPGAVVGPIARNYDEAKRLHDQGQKVILVRHDTSPEDLPAMMLASAIVTRRGGATCHAAVVARELGLAAVVGVDSLDIPGSGNPIYSVVVQGALAVVVPLALNLDTPTLTKEVSIFRRWQAKEARKAFIDFDAFEQHFNFSANEELADFYLTDAMAAEAVGSELELAAARLRTETHRQIAGRFAVYLLAAIGGEARHCYNKLRRLSPVGAKALLKLEAIVNLKSLAGDLLPDDAQELVIQLLCGKLELCVTFLKAACDLFGDCLWQSQYGGKAWHRIAQTLLQYLEGELTATLFVDRVFDLRHNGNALFDKHVMYSRRTGEYRLYNLLEKKKEAQGISQLYDVFSQLSWAPPVKQLWNQGEKLELWKFKYTWE